MALSVTHRRSIRTSLVPVLGEEEADALLAELPAKPGDEPVTRADLDLRFADLDLRFAAVDLRFAETHARMDIGFAQVRTEIAELRTEMHKGFQRVYAWGAAVLLGGLTLGTTIATLLGQAINS